MRRNFVAILSVLLILPALAAAQSLDGSIGNTDPLTLSTDPQYPAPFSSVTLSVLSSLLDLTNATMKVLVNGKQTYQGSVQPVSVTLGKAGSTASIAVTVSSAGTDYSKSLVIQPQDISLIAEPVSSAPALYPGKPLIPLEGNTRVVAVAALTDAGGRVADPTSLSYAWTVDGVRIADSSGIGKNTIMVASPLQYRVRPVSVSIQSQDGTLVGGADLSLAPTEPTIRVYENDPLLGIRFDHALSGPYAITGTEASLYAAAYSLPVSGPGLLFRWFLNGSAAQTGSSITLRPSGSGQGTASLSVTASAGGSTVATANLPVSFGAKQSSNFFGL